MTPKLQIAAIKTALSTYLPAALTAAGLDNFESYLSSPPNNVDKRQLGVYMVRNTKTPGMRSRTFVIDIQLPGVMDFDAKYDSAISSVIEQRITAEIVEMMDVEEIDANLFPVEPNEGATFLLYIIRFSEELDSFD